MHIVAHLGHDDKTYEAASAAYWPEDCPTCRGRWFGPHDTYRRWGLEGQVQIRRFRCYQQDCRQVWSVLPSFLTRGQSYATAVEEEAVRRYVEEGETYAAAAAATAVSVTTVFRWVARAAEAAAATLLHAARLLLEYAPEQSVPLLIRPEERGRACRWQARRVRPAKVERLLRLCVLVRCLTLLMVSLRLALPPVAGPVCNWGIWRWSIYPSTPWNSTTNGNSLAASGC